MVWFGVSVESFSTTDAGKEGERLPKSGELQDHFE